MKFVILAVVMVLMAGVLHMVFIGFDYAFFNPDSGGLLQLSDKLNDSLNVETRNRAWNQSQMFRQGFGIGRVICLALVPVLVGIEVFSKPRIQGD